VEFRPVHGLGEIRPGDHLGERLLAALRRAGQRLQDGDIVVVTQKVISKAENRLVDLGAVVPSPLAQAWAEEWGKDSRQVEVVLRESRRVVRMDHGVIISETHHGFVCANAGVDASNVSGGNVVSLLPPDPDASADMLRRTLEAASGVPVGVIVSDTFGRPWREGQVNVAIGAAGVEVLRRYQGQVDPYGYELRVTEIATADEIAAAAELVMGKTDSVAAVLVRGLGRSVVATGEGAAALIRPPEKDLFR
jgi:coenzyme F420-0:L-glutamate ligase/coenzyme F420-1:gamma-L-glutamate ligase